MRQAGRDRHGHRLSALIVVLWRAGLRINEALSLAETDLDQRRGSILVRHGLCRIRHRPRYAVALLMPSWVLILTCFLFCEGVEFGITLGRRSQAVEEREQGVGGSISAGVGVWGCGSVDRSLLEAQVAM